MKLKEYIEVIIALGLTTTTRSKLFPSQLPSLGKIVYVIVAFEDVTFVSC
jgi:hypothetical protein